MWLCTACASQKTMLDSQRTLQPVYRGSRIHTLYPLYLIASQSSVLLNIHTTTKHVLRTKTKNVRTPEYATVICTAHHISMTETTITSVNTIPHTVAFITHVYITGQKYCTIDFSAERANENVDRIAVRMHP